MIYCPILLGEKDVKMIYFLTSSPTGSLDGLYQVDGLDEKNSFRENLKKHWREHAKCLMIAATPDAYEQNDEMTDFFFHAVENSGLSVEKMDLIDDRYVDITEEELHKYDVIFLGGGHVPTQNDFFRRLGLRDKIQGFDGIVIGISAGSMNSADVVYAQPELDGEDADPDYQRFITGLGLTRTQILPHYQMVKDYVLDGRRLYEEITCGDSYGNAFLILPDGSYLMSENGKEKVWGEAYCYSNGSFFQINEDGSVRDWPLD